MSTLGELKTRIADEIDRTDLSSQIALAIDDAIKRYERRRFWFNQSRTLTFDTVAAQRFYGIADATWIPTVIEIDQLFVSVGGQNYLLRRRDPLELEMLSDNSAASGQPYAWAYYQDQISLYPFPDQAYTVTAYAHYRLDSLATDGDENAWTDDAEELIRSAAKRQLYQHVVLDSQKAQAMKMAEDEAFRFLNEETSRRLSLGGVIYSSPF